MTSQGKVEPYLWLARLESQQGRKDGALEHLKKALELQQNDADAWAAIANFYFINHQMNEAKLAYETVISLPNGMSSCVYLEEIMF